MNLFLFCRKVIILFLILCFSNRGNAQKFIENVDYIPEFNSKSITIINLTDTVKILFVTDSTLIAFTGTERYDTLTLKEHLKSYRLDQITAFYQRQKGKIVAKTIVGGAVLGLTGGVLGYAASSRDLFDEVDGFTKGFTIGGLFGIGVGLISGIANYQKYDWRKDDSIGLKIKKIKKYQACSFILPYHLKSLVDKLVVQ